MYSCPNCGAVVYYGEPVCQTCGIELDWSTTEAPPPGDEYQQQEYSQQQWDEQQYDRQQWEQPPEQYRQADYGQYYPPGQQIKPGGASKGRKDSGAFTGNLNPGIRIWPPWLWPVSIKSTRPSRENSSAGSGSCPINTTGLFAGMPSKAALRSGRPLMASSIPASQSISPSMEIGTPWLTSTDTPDILSARVITSASSQRS